MFWGIFMCLACFSRFKSFWGFSVFPLPDFCMKAAFTESQALGTVNLEEDVAEAEYARIGIPMICEDRHGIYMSAQPVMIAYAKSKDMMFEETFQVY